MRPSSANEIQHRDGRIELIDTERIDASPLSNADLAPVPVSARDWTTYNYAALWISVAHYIPTYMLASGLVAAGMNWWRPCYGCANLKSAAMKTRSETDSLGLGSTHSPGVQASVVVAVVIFSIRPDADGRPRVQVLLVQRAVEPFAGSWSLPGGKLWGDEALDEAAWRQLLEKTALRASYLEQLYTFELCDAARQIEAAVVAYYALVRTDGTEIAPGRKTMEAAWFPVDELPAELAFDNDEILHYALQRLRNKVEYALVAFQFLPPLFTMAQLRAVYEVIRGRRIDPTNFRRRVEATGSILPTGNSVPGGRHRPPALYRCAGDPASLVKTLRPRRALRSLPELTGRTSTTS